MSFSVACGFKVIGYYIFLLTKLARYEDSCSSWRLWIGHLSGF